MSTLSPELLKKVGLASLEPADQASVLEAVADALERRVGARIADALTTEACEQMTELMARDDREATLTFMTLHVPQHQTFVLEELKTATRWLQSHARAILRSAPHPVSKCWAAGTNRSGARASR